MSCKNCKYAVWDCYEYYGTTQKQWFIEDCKKSDMMTDEVMKAWQEDNTDDINCPNFREIEEE